MEITINITDDLMTLINAYSDMMNIENSTTINQLCQIGAEELGIEYKIDKQRNSSSRKMSDSIIKGLQDEIDNNKI